MAFKSLYDRRPLAESVFASPARRLALQRAKEAVESAKRTGGSAAVEALARAATRATIAKDEHPRPDQPGPDVPAE